MITKAILPIAGLGTRFLPLTKVLPKELLPLGAFPLLHYALLELKKAGVQEVIFVVNTNRKLISDYLKKAPALEKLLGEQGKDELAEELKKAERAADGMTFTFAPDKPLGDGHAVLQAKKHVGDEAAYVVYPDDVVVSDVPAVEQLGQVFKTAERPVLGLFLRPKDKLSSYGVVASDSIARRLGKLRQIVEKPEPGKAPSNLAVVGRSIVTPEVFDYLKKSRANKRGEVSLTETFGRMVADGKVVYGQELQGEWLECGDRENWMLSTLKVLLSDAKYRDFVKEEKLV